MKYLDIRELNRRANRARSGVMDAWILLTVVFFAAIGLVVETHGEQWLAAIVAVAVAALILSSQWTKFQHAGDMVSVEREIADFDDEEEEEADGMCFSTFINNTGRDILAGTPVYVIPPAPKMKPPMISVPVGTGKTGAMKKMLDDEGYVMVFSYDGMDGYAKPPLTVRGVRRPDLEEPPKCECVFDTFVVYPDGWNEYCTKCGKPVQCHAEGV